MRVALCLASSLSAAALLPASAFAASESDIADHAVTLIARAGFIGLGCVLIFLVLPLLGTLKVSRSWFVPAVAVGVTSIAFGIWLQPRYSYLYGGVKNVPLGRDLQIASDLLSEGNPVSAYIRRKIEAGGNDFDFVVISRDMPKCINIALPKLGNETGATPSFDVKLSDDDYGSGRKLFVSMNDDLTTAAVVRQEDEQRRSAEIAAHAEDCVPTDLIASSSGASDTASVRKQLLSDNVFERRRAKAALVKNRALKEISELLSQSEYRLRVEAVEALAKVSGAIPEPMKSELRAKLESLKASHDASEPTLKRAIETALHKVA